MKKDPIEICVVCRTGDSGLTDYSLCLIPELERHGRVTFVTATTALKHPARGNIEIVPIFRRMRHIYLDWFVFLRYALTQRPKIILMQSWLGFPFFDTFFIRFLKAFHIDLAITAHDILPHHPTPFSRFSCGLFFRSFDRIIAHSEASKEQLLSMGVTAPILVVPHGEYDVFNLDKLDRAEARTRLGGIGNDEFVALFFGHLDQRKGLAEFLNVADSMGGRGIKFIVAGKDDLSPNYKGILKRTWPEHIRADVGHVPFEKVQEYFAAADAVILPYREGTTSGVLKIAMAFGKPVIATPVGDIQETLGEWPGILIPMENIEDGLRKGIEKMMGQRSEYSAHAAESREHYSWAHIGARYVDFLLN